MNNFTSQILFQSKIEDQKITILKKYFPNCFNKNGEFINDKFQEFIKSSDIKTNQESYTLQWLGKSYAKALNKLPPETLLAEDLIHNRKEENNKSQNVLIKGDNLEVLKHLKNAYSEQVKMIYIDPPYNTGTDGFVYQDDRKFTAEQLAELGNMDIEAAQKVLNFTNKKSNSHSAWLTFMYPRLYIARELLHDDGVIFISIDDNEQAQLKLLCDEVFGENCFMAEFIWDKKNSAKGVPPKNMIVGIHEYILCYSKIPNAKLYGEIRTKEGFNNPDNDERGEWRLSNIKSTIERSQDKFTIVDPLTGRLFNNFWAFSKTSLERMIKENRIVFPKNDDGLPKQKEFFNEFDNPYIPIKSNLGWFDPQSKTEKQVEKLLGQKIFLYRKPLDLMFKLISQGCRNGGIILDFFAGSGTTAHAVMKLNAVDNGNRKFILVQLPELTDKKSEGYKAGFKTIFDITKARIEKSAIKIHEEYPNYNGDLGFKIFETVADFRPSIMENNQTLLYPVQYFSDEQIQTLLTTWRVFDGQALTEQVQAVDIANYLAYLCGETLYLLHSEFSSTQIKTLIELLDNTENYRDFAPKRIILHGDMIESSKQKELAQAVQTYANKKNILISLIARV